MEVLGGVAYNDATGERWYLDSCEGGLKWREIFGRTVAGSQHQESQPIMFRAIRHEWEVRTMTIEDQIKRLDERINNISDHFSEELVHKCPRGIYTRGNASFNGGLKMIDPCVDEVLVAVLDHLGLEPIITPEKRVELREKKDE